eukprot:m.128037 g.128037  ORF g.128037 m.128037 type:complete len:661 (+) comp16724_c3_seq2:61-2043(+)
MAVGHLIAVVCALMAVTVVAGPRRPCATLAPSLCWHDSSAVYNITSHVPSHDQCCELCRSSERAKCQAWAFYNNPNTHAWECHLYQSTPAHTVEANCTSGFPSTAPPAHRKNLLFLQCDEMDGRVLDPRHPLSKVTRMPHLERLASRGVNFVNTYTPNPLCAPSRASMWTGRRSSSIQAWSNVKSLMSLVEDPTRPDPICARVTGYGPDTCVELGKRQNVSTSIKHTFESLGFDVSLNGKMDTGGGMGGGFHGSGHWTGEDQGGLYYPGCELHSWAATANISRPALYPLYGQNNWINTNSPNGGPFAQDWRTVDECVRFLRNYKASDPPFLLYCSVVDPHPPYYSNTTWFEFVNQTALNESIAASAASWPPRKGIHPADAYSSISEGVGLHALPDVAYPLALAYHGQTAETDHMMGLVLDALDNSAANNKTFTLFTADHGEMHLEHQLVEKMSMYEGSVRVPLIVAGPGIGGNRMVTNFTSLLDVFPTFLDLVGVAPPSFLHGLSLAPLLGLNTTQPAAFHRPAHVVSEYMGEESVAPTFMLRQGSLKLVVRSDGRNRDSRQGHHSQPHLAPQLFNVDDDPHEANDLASDHADIVNQLDDILRSVVDYDTVAGEVVLEGKTTAKRWASQFPAAEVESMFYAAYDGASAQDYATFQTWIGS